MAWLAAYDEWKVLLRKKAECSLAQWVTNKKAALSSLARIHHFMGLSLSTAACARIHSTNCATLSHRPCSIG